MAGTAVAVAATERELEAARKRSFGIAYRMLGSVTEAEDVAQESMLRLARTEEEVKEPLAWITTVATRLSINVLRLARIRRESYVGPWLPEPLIDDEAPDPGAHAEVAESVSQAFLVVLERLTPVERAAFLLREVFEYDYREIAHIIDRSEANTRQLVVRAKKHLDRNRPRFDPDQQRRDELLERFLAAAEAGDLEALESILATDAALYSDGGGRASAARKPIFGRARLARVFIAMARTMRRHGPMTDQLIHIGGQPGAIRLTPDGEIFSVFSMDVVGGQIKTIWVMRNPDKLTHLSAGKPMCHSARPRVVIRPRSRNGGK
jgi:RNA polymerase sigma-70 factor, ECF subfamily